MKSIGVLRGVAVSGLLLAAAGSCSASRPSTEPSRASRAPLTDTWYRTQMLHASDSDAYSQYGVSVAVSSDTVLVGSYGGSQVASFQGLAYAYSRAASGVGWGNEQKLIASDGAAGDQLAESMAISGDSLVLGAPNAGAAYVFTRSGGLWAQSKQLTASDTGGSFQFGSSVALDGDVALVGAPGTSTLAGALYVYTRSGSTWTEKKRVASDSVPGDGFGSAVALSGNTAVAAGQASTYVLVRDSAGNWSEQQKLPIGSSKGTVGVAGDLLVVGAHPYTRSGSTWTAGPVLDPELDTLGSVKAQLSAKWAMLAGPGTARIYEFSGSGWSEIHGIGGSDIQVGESVGVVLSAATDGQGIAVVGLSNLDATPEPRAYVYERTLPCSTDSDCPSTAYCASAGQCQPRVLPGAACSGLCKQSSGCRVCLDPWLCADGVCCDAGCSGACEACSVATGAQVDGQCHYLARGADYSTCSNGLTCNGQSGSCVGCATDADCPAQKYCAADGTCQSQKALGSACNTDAGTTCKEGHCRVCAGSASGASGDRCVEGLCCDTAAVDCGGCKACNAAVTGLSDGQCAPVPAGTDPHDFCAEAPAETCDADGQCDGNGACRTLSPKGRLCGAGSCVSGVLAARACNGGHTCDVALIDCSPFKCVSDACASACSSDSDCTPGVHCNAAHACEAASATTGGGCSGPDCGVTASGGCSVRPAHGASPRGPLALLGVAAALARKRRRARQA